VRADAAHRRLGRVPPRGPAGSGADPDRARRPLAPAPGRADGDGGHRAWPRRCLLGRRGGAGDGSARDTIQRTRHPRGICTRWGLRRHGRGGDAMTTLAAPPPSTRAAPAPQTPTRLGRPQWLAALAILFVLFTPYQTLVQTVITDDAVRKSIEADEYDMTWVTVAYGVGVLYGVFAGLSLSLRIGKRYTLVLAMLVFSAGNILCGAATGLVSLALARFVERSSKMLAMAIFRVTLYKQFDRVLLFAIGFYGVFAYSTRHITPLVNAYLDVYLSWRWMYWAYVPVGLVAALLVWMFIRPDRPQEAPHVSIDLLAITTFVAWIVAAVFALGCDR